MKNNARSVANSIRSLSSSAIVLATLLLSSGPYPSHAAGLEPAQTLTQGGTFPVNGLAGDAFGQVVAFNRDFLFVASPGSQPDNKSIAGAVFVYRWDGTQYRPSQTIATAGTGDHLSMLQILAQDEWLMLSVNGTPVGPQVNDTVADQDFRGAVLIYRLNRRNGQWEPSQSLDRSTPGLGGLSPIADGGIPILLTQQGANFGLRMALDAGGGWLLAAALYQNGIDAQNNPVLNAGAVYAFRLHRPTGEWRLAQVLGNPDGPILNDGFGASVAVKGRYAMIGNGTVFQGPHVGNAAVYVYELAGGAWRKTQRLTGTQSEVTPLLFPQFSPDEIGVGDAFGNAIALSDDEAIIAAPLESSEGSVFTGAAYVFRLEQRPGGERWIGTQRIVSSDPNALAFGAFNVALDGRTAVIGDLGWSGPAGAAQGAVQVYRRQGPTWQKMLTLADETGSPGAAFGISAAFGPGGRLAVGSSPFLGFFIPVVFRPPPASAPPVAPGKVIIYEASGH